MGLAWWRATCLLRPRAITPGLSHNGGHCASRTRRGCLPQANVSHHIEKVSAKDGHNRVDTLTELSATMHSCVLCKIMRANSR